MLPKLYMSDIFKFYSNYESSRIKIWEIVRTYDPIDFAMLLYLLENTSKHRNRKPITVDKLNVICKNGQFILTMNNTYDLTNNYYNDNTTNNNHNDVVLTISKTPSIRLERAIYHENNKIFWNSSSPPLTTTTMRNVNSTIVDNEKKSINNVHISKVMDDIRCGKKLNNINNDNIVIDDDDDNDDGDDDDDDDDVINNVNNDNNSSSNETNETDEKLLEKILHHNLGTQEYTILLKNVQNLLFSETFQFDRNEINYTNKQSIVMLFLQFYKNLFYKENLNNDPRNFRYLVIPAAERIHTRDLTTITSNPKDDLIIQPLYQGFHMIVYSSPTETKCFNRFGELTINVAYNLRSNEPCTFEAILLPKDQYNNIRSWRYWPYKHNWVMYIVDVYRYKQTILVETPFKERMKYIKLIENNDRLLSIPDNLLNNWETIENQYITNKDLYDPIIGVVIRKASSLVSDAEPINEFRFNILYAFNLLSNTIIDLENYIKSNEITLESSTTLKSSLSSSPSSSSSSSSSSFKIKNINHLHLNFEMADYKTICIVYGHDSQYLYICQYDRNIHQFVHAASLERLPYDNDKLLAYKPEQLYVINCKVLPRGVFYIRIYYDVCKNIIGYDHKLTDGRYKMPYQSILLTQINNNNNNRNTI